MNISPMCRENSNHSFRLFLGRDDFHNKIRPYLFQVTSQSNLPAPPSNLPSSHPFFYTHNIFPSQLPNHSTATSAGAELWTHSRTTKRTAREPVTCVAQATNRLRAVSSAFYFLPRLYSSASGRTQSFPICYQVSPVSLENHTSSKIFACDTRTCTT